ncbi:MAG: right-handed parallel beta-helix repeat-containing protein, partial [Patescibacteria group bacterium]
GYSNSYRAPVNIKRVTAMFDGCRILGSTTAVMNAGIYIEYGATVTMADCLVSGCHRVGVNIGNSVSNDVIIKRCTIVGNVIDISVNNASTANSITDCLIGSKTGPGSADIITKLPSTCGFVAPCPDVIDSSTWTNTLWQSWDFRLTPESPYLTGAETASAENADLLGNPRQVGGALGAFEGSWLVFFPGETKTLTADTIVDYCEFRIGNTVVLDGVDRILQIKRDVYRPYAIFFSETRGYFATPPGIDDSESEFYNVVSCKYGADASNFAVTQKLATWTSNDPAVSVLLEKLVDGKWETTIQTTGESFSDEIPFPLGASMRLFDGESFLPTTVVAAPLDFHTWTVYNNTLLIDTSPKYTVVKDYMMMSSFYNRGETPLLFARIQDSADASLVAPADIGEIVYTCYRKTTSWATETRVPVFGHENVSIPIESVLEAAVTDDPRWTVDESGYNFIYEPDSRVNPLFPTAGDYVLVVTVHFISGNPCPISYEISVN